MQSYAVDVTAQLNQHSYELVSGADVPQPSPVAPGRVPFQVGDTLGGRGPRGVQRHLDLGEDAGRTGGGSGRGDRRQVAPLDEGDVELCGGNPVGPSQDDELALGRARHDRRALDGIGLTGEVDVVEPFAVEVAAGGHGPDDRVVLPRVPQGAGHLDPVTDSRVRAPASSTRGRPQARAASGRSSSVTTHPARPAEMWSRAANWLETWKGSAYVTGTTGAIPMVLVDAATKAARSTAPIRPTGSGAAPGGSTPSSRVSRVNPAFSAMAATRATRRGASS